MSWCDLTVTSHLGSTRMFLLLYLRHNFSYHKDVWIASTDYHMYVNLIVLSLLTAICQLINFTAI